ncbi:hypothetical protein ABZV14_44845 [Streptosporangium canum]|uniref:hypothetical protein n=1 Tax=Streptosporangium canum TaxID=324952 RepID=UPI0033BF4859
MRRRRKARAKAAGLGRSRGGLSGKVHAAVDAAGLPPAFVLTPGQAADCPRFITVLNKRGSAGGRPVLFDPERYRQRNTVERCFQKIKTWRGLATRYDKAPESYEAGLYLRGSIMWLKLLTSTT